MQSTQKLEAINWRLQQINFKIVKYFQWCEAKAKY